MQKIYIHLFHGREEPDEDMDGWGESGPVLGPFLYAHTVYACQIYLGTIGHNGKEDGDDQILHMHEDMVYYDGMFYGDWSILPKDRVREHGMKGQKLIDKKAKLPPIDPTNKTYQKKLNAVTDLMRKVALMDGFNDVKEEWNKVGELMDIASP